MAISAGSVGGVIGTGIVFSLIDKFSNVGDKIIAKFTKLEGVTERAAAKITKGAKMISAGFKTMAVGAALLTPLLIGVAMSAQLGDQLADVTKTTGIAGIELQKLRGEIEAIDTRTSVEDLVAMAAAAGQMGVAKKDVFGFTNAMDKLQVALGDQFAGPQELGRQLGNLRNVLRDIKTDNISEDILRIGNVLNFMGANAAAVEGQIANVVSRFAGLGQELGLSTAQMFGASTALLEMGSRAEVIGTNFPLALSKMANNIDKFAKVAGLSSAEFKKAVNKDVLGAFQLVAVGAKKVAPDTVSMAKLLDNLGLAGGRLSEIFLKTAGGTELFTLRVKQAESAIGNTNSIMEEFNAKNNTLQAVLDKSGKQMGILFTRIGDAIAPAVELMAKGLTSVLKVLTAFATSQFGQVIVNIVAALGAALVVGGGFIVMAGIMKIVLSGLIPILIALLLPIIKIVAIVALVVGAFLFVTKSIKAFKEVLEGTAAPATGFMLFMQQVGGILTAVGEIWESAGEKGFSMSKKLEDALGQLGILDFVVTLGTFIVRIKQFFSGVGAILGPVFDIVKKVIVKIFEAIDPFKSAFDKMSDGLNKAGGSMLTWKRIGKAIGIVITAVLLPMILALVSAFLFVVAIIKVVVTVFQFLRDAIIGTINFVSSLLDQIAPVLNSFVNFGKSMVESIKKGISNAWADFKLWFMEMFDTLVAPVKFTLDALGLGDEGTATVAPSANATKVESIGKTIAENQAAKIAAQRPVVFDKSTQSTEVRDVNFVIDGRVFKEVIDEQNDLEQRRS